jgi:hypothetical protein
VSSIGKVRPTAGVEGCTSVGRIFQALEFMKDYPIKSIAELKAGVDFGLYIVNAKIADIVLIDPWWYPVCGCNIIVDTYIGAFNCQKCGVSDFLIVPK